MQEISELKRFYRKSGDEEAKSPSPLSAARNAVITGPQEHYDSDKCSHADDEEEASNDDHTHAVHRSLDEETGEHETIQTGIGMPFKWKSPVRDIRTPQTVSAALRRISKPRSLPYYATEEYKAINYNPATRPAVLPCQGFVPLIQAASVSNLLQRDVTDALIVLSAQVLKHVFFVFVHYFPSYVRAGADTRDFWRASCPVWRCHS